ncbi:putative inactive receptor kinase At1g48480 [Wolffia australiana]
MAGARRSAAALLLLLLVAAAIAAELNLASDKAALLAFRDAVGRPSLGWNAATSPCSWRGVACSSSNRVSSLRLPASNLLGPFPSSAIANLTFLHTLSLRSNRLSGSFFLPPLPHLRNLYLHENLLSGPIPPSIASLSNLVRLNLARNNFSGAIPPEIGLLNRLRTLSLEENHLSGQIPELNLSLDQFNASFNRFTGSIPSSLRSMPPSAFLGLDLCGLPTSPCPKNKNKIGAIVGIAIGGVLALFLLALFLLWRRRRRRRAVEGVAPEPERGGKEEVSEGKGLVFFSGEGFDVEELLRAPAEAMGKGCFGSTYKAVLEERGREVAVKRLRKVGLAEEEFKAVVEVAGGMGHPNLVQLRAYYYGRDEKLLVCDFLPGGSLFSLLHGQEGLPLTWRARVEAALGAARGLHHIHSAGPGICHGNITSFNVLFHSPSVAQVSDQGLARLACHLPAPSQPADVYNFGVLLLELVTGKAPSLAPDMDLPRWVRSVAVHDWLAEVLDPDLVSYHEAHPDMVRLMQLALHCTAHDPRYRPAMAEVVAQIELLHGAAPEEQESMEFPRLV